MSTVPEASERLPKAPSKGPGSGAGHLHEDYYTQPEVWARQSSSQAESIRAHLLVELVPESARVVVDVGCGSGFVTDRIGRPTVIGLDPHRLLVQGMKSARVVGSAEFGKVDVFVLSELLEHLSSESLSSLLREVGRVSPGTIIVSVPEEEDLTFVTCKCPNGHVFQPYWHLRTFTEHDFPRLFPGYLVTALVRSTPVTRYSRWLRKFGLMVDFHFSVPGAICPRCSQGPQPPPLLVRQAFRGLLVFDRVLQTLKGRHSTYHLIVRLERGSSERRNQVRAKSPVVHDQVHRGVAVEPGKIRVSESFGLKLGIDFRVESAIKL